MVPAPASDLGPLALLQPGSEEEEPAAADAAGGPASRVSSGGPAGDAPLIKAVRAKQLEVRRTVHAWLDRFAADQHGGMAELVTLVLVVADVPSCPEVEGMDVRDQDPIEIVQELVAKVALEASEKGADFTQHWLVSRERGAVRVRDNYPVLWRELVAAAPRQVLLGGLLKLLRDWVLALADCQFRSVRHAATLAGLQLVEGLGLQCRVLEKFCRTATLRVKDAEAQGVTSTLHSLSAELQHAHQSARELGEARDSLGLALLSRRTKDVDIEIRRMCFEAISRWAKADPETFISDPWTRYLHFGLSDRDAKARGAVLAALHELLRLGGGTLTPAVEGLAEHVRPRILARCHDVDPAVGAAALRCAIALASSGLLAEQEFDPVIDLVWDPDAERRGEAATFVSRFVFSEDILDYASSQLPPGSLVPTGNGKAVTLRRVLMLLQFMGEYSDGHNRLVDRLVGALWRRASCLEDWEVLASLALPGGEHSVSGEQHTTLMHLEEAIARLASEDAAAAGKPDVMAHAEAVLARAARAFAPQIPALLEACQPEPAAFRCAAGLCRHVLRHCAAERGGAGSSGCRGLVAGPVGQAAAQALRVAFLRQPDPEALEHIAEALAHLLDLSAGTRPVVREVAEQMRDKFLRIAPVLAEPKAKEVLEGEVPPADALLSTATRLRILAKAFDVSLCDLQNFGAAVLGLLDDRAAAVAEGCAPAIHPQLTVVLLQLVVLVLVRHVAAYVQPQPLARCVAHDPVDPKELQLAPTAAQDLCTVVATLLKADPDLQVRTAAFASAVALLTASWNASRFAGAAVQGTVAATGVERDIATWVLPFSEELASSLCAFLGELLTEANAVPASLGVSPPAPELGCTDQASAFTQLFNAVQQNLARAPSGTDAIPDSERVRAAVLTCALLAGCRHSDVERSSLPSLVLSQVLSPREDMQEAAWLLLRRLRKEAHWHTESAENFFRALLQTIRLVHQDAGVSVARDLSLRFMQRVGVGKLSPTLQVALITVLREAIERVLAREVHEGLLEALVPWVTKHLVDDTLLEDLVSWIEQQATAAGGETSEDLAKQVGLRSFLEACFTTVKRGQHVHDVAGQAQHLATDADTALPAKMARLGLSRKRRRAVATRVSQDAACQRLPGRPRVLGPDSETALVD